MLSHLYLRKGIVYVPTVAQTEAGFYLDVEPVRVVPASDSKALQGAIEETMRKGNPMIRTPTRGKFPKPIVLDYAKVKSWAAFEKSALVWSIEEKDGNYQIKPARRRPDRGWEDDLEQTESLPSGTMLAAVAQRVSNLVQIALENGL